MPSLIQKITISGEELPLINIPSASFHESGDLYKPELVLNLADRSSLIDLIGLKYGSTVSVILSELISDNLQEEIEFKVQSIVPTKNEDIKIVNCMESNIFDAMQKQPKGIYFNKESVSHILRQLFPKVKHFDIDQFPILGDFHIPSGSQINKEIQDQLCRQYAAMCWISRNKLYFKSITGLFDRVPIATYTNNRSNDNAYQVVKIYPVENKNKERQILSEYHGYHHELGYIKGGKIGYPKMVTSFDNKIILDNLAIGSKTALDFDAPGSGLIQPCKMINFQWISNNPEMPINESLPSKALVTQQNHWIEGETHKMRLGMSAIIQ